jgi:hypothetical protein
MADVLNWIISASKQYSTDLGSISQKVSQNLFNKGSSSGEKSLFSFLTQYSNQDTEEYKKQLENFKKKPVLDKINNLYGDKTFSGRYGIDIMKVGFVIFLFMVAITYIHIQNNLLQVKRDWPEYRCRPDVMPFAGWINAPEGVSPIDYTAQNFAECSVNTVKGVYEKRASMVYVIFNDRMRNALKDIFITVFYRIQNFIIPVQNMLIKMVDFFEKIKGILATFLLTMIGILWSFYSLIGSIYELVILILVIMIVVIIVLWYIPFVGWALAIAAIAVFLTIAIPLIMLGIVSRQITRQRTSQMPSP